MLDAAPSLAFPFSLPLCSLAPRHSECVPLSRSYTSRSPSFAAAALCACRSPHPAPSCLYDPESRLCNSHDLSLLLVKFAPIASVVQQSSVCKCRGGRTSPRGARKKRRQGASRDACTAPSARRAKAESRDEMRGEPHELHFASQHPPALALFTSPLRTPSLPFSSFSPSSQPAQHQHAELLIQVRPTAVCVTPPSALTPRLLLQSRLAPAVLCTRSRRDCCAPVCAAVASDMFKAAISHPIGLRSPTAARSSLASDGSHVSPFLAAGRAAD
jgi:hypothetical protein